MIAEKRIITFKNVFDTPFPDKLRIWRNQDFVRLKMVNQDFITEEQHHDYLEKIKKGDSHNKIYIAFEKDIPFGVVIFTVNEKDNYIEPAQYLVDEKFLGKGYGKIVRFAQIEYIFKVLPDGEMRTKILSHNVVNLDLNKKMGAKIRSIEKFTDINGIGREAYVLYLNAPMWQKKRKKILCDIKAKCNDIVIGEIQD